MDLTDPQEWYKTTKMENLVLDLFNPLTPKISFVFLLTVSHTIHMM